MAFDIFSNLFNFGGDKLGSEITSDSLAGMPQGSQDAFQSSVDNTAYSAEEEPWDWEEDEHDMALRDFEGMSPELQAKQVRENKWKGRFQAIGQEAPGMLKKAGKGLLGMAAGAGAGMGAGSSATSSPFQYQLYGNSMNNRY
tara:strand:- start:4696 stop:5121 length:426 start_codon:yes stop_codon:yes gene_type:complete